MRPFGLAALASLWFFHNYYMLFRKFDYGLNMTICIVLGVVQGVSWCLWSQVTNHPGKCALFCSSTANAWLPASAASSLCCSCCFQPC